MTVELDAIKSLAVDGVELKKLYANNQLVWKRASAWRRQLDLYPRAVRSDEEGNLYVLASSKVESSAAKVLEYKLIKLNGQGEIVFSISISDIPKNNYAYDRGFCVVENKIYLAKYNSFVALDKENGETLMEIDSTYGNPIGNKPFVSYNLFMLIAEFYDIRTVDTDLMVIKKQNLVITQEWGFVRDIKVFRGVHYILTSRYLYSSSDDLEIVRMYTFSTTSSDDSLCAFDVDETGFYILATDSLTKYDYDFNIIWSVSLSGPPKGTGSLVVTQGKVVTKTNVNILIYNTENGELLYSKVDTNSLFQIAGSQTRDFPMSFFLAPLQDDYFCSLSYDEKCVYKLELGDEDTYENLD